MGRVFRKLMGNSYNNFQEVLKLKHTYLFKSIFYNFLVILIERQQQRDGVGMGRGKKRGRQGRSKRECFHLLMNCPQAHNSTGLQVGNFIQVSQWEAWTQGLESSPLPPKMCTGRKLETRKELRFCTSHSTLRCRHPDGYLRPLPELSEISTYSEKARH